MFKFMSTRSAGYTCTSHICLSSRMPRNNTIHITAINIFYWLFFSIVSVVPKVLFNRGSKKLFVRSTQAYERVRGRESFVDESLRMSLLATGWIKLSRGSFDNLQRWFCKSHLCIDKCIKCCNSEASRPSRAITTEKAQACKETSSSFLCVRSDRGTSTIISLAAHLTLGPEFESCWPIVLKKKGWVALVVPISQQLLCRLYVNMRSMLCWGKVEVSLPKMISRPENRTSCKQKNDGRSRPDASHKGSFLHWAFHKWISLSLILWFTFRV